MEDYPSSWNAAVYWDLGPGLTLPESLRVLLSRPKRDNSRFIENNRLIRKILSILLV